MKGDPKGTSLLIFGAGLAGMSAAYALRAASHQLHEYREKVRGRFWTPALGRYLYRAGRLHAAAGSSTPACGPARATMLDCCKRLRVIASGQPQRPSAAVPRRLTAKPQRFKRIAAHDRRRLAELMASAARPTLKCFSAARKGEHRRLGHRTKAERSFDARVATDAMRAD